MDFILAHGAFRTPQPIIPPFSSFCKISAIALSITLATILSDYKTSLALAYNYRSIQASFEGDILLGILASYTLHIAFELST